MLNRRHIRIKVMQTLYAFNGTEGDDFNKDEKFLLHSLNSMYNLYLLILSLLIEVQKKAEDHLEKSQKKHLATKEEKNPSRKFVDNAVLNMLSNNSLLADEIKNRKLNYWNLNFEYIDIVYKAIIESSIYKHYMAKNTTDFNEDRNFIIDIFKEVIAPNDKLYEFYEDKKLTWIDDLPIVNTSLLKLLRKLKPNSVDSFFLPKLYKDEEDKEFALQLFQKSVLNQNKFKEEIATKTINWDSERLASLDAVLMRMALCEFQKFPSIPVKVTINEYLEIAKEYSTPKSSVFINGILDKVVREYKEKDTLNKVGRGLM